MRPVNLIPSEQRQEHSAIQGGPAYILVAALVAVLAGVTLLVTTNNQVSDKKAEVNKLQREVIAANTRSGRLSAYTGFASVRDQRVAAVTSLADSRFDWERVMRELALILPRGDAWLTELSGSVSPEVQAEGGGSVTLRASVPGPALELIGCAKSQDAVAGFISALKDIDGATRVGVQSSQLTDSAGSAEATTDAAGPGASSECEERTTKFEIAVAFDAAPAPPTATTEEVTVEEGPATPAPAPEG